MRNEMNFLDIRRYDLLQLLRNEFRAGFDVFSQRG